MHLNVKKPFLWIIASVALLAIPMLTNGYSQYIVNLILAYVTIGIGFNILLGFAGQFSFASAAFMGIGAYTTAILSSTFDFPFWLCIPFAGVFTAVIGMAISIPALRVASIYLALVTFAFAELMVWVFLNWKSLTLGANGIGVATPEFMGYKFSGDTMVYYLLLPLVALAFWTSLRILKSAVGRSFVMVRESEIVARCNGIDVARTKMIAFGLSAFFGGIGGAFFAYVVGFILPSSFGLFQLIIHIAIVVVGGMGSLVGPIIGAIMLTLIPEFLRDFQSLQEILFGATLVVVAIFVPKGFAGLLRKAGILPEERLVGCNSSKLGAHPSKAETSLDTKGGNDD